MSSLHLQVRLFGVLSVCCHKQLLPNPPTLKSQSLLAYLIVHRAKSHFREQLADRFWSDRPERKARRSLNTAVWHIRHSLPEEICLISNPLTVQFNPQVPLWLDTHEFEKLASLNELVSLEEAVALYRSDFLDGFYDDWTVNERYRLETLFGDTLAQLMVMQEQGGAYEAALGTSLRLLNLDSLREDAHRVAMRVYCRLGNRSAALKQYLTCQETLQDELGAEPLAETRTLYQDILEGRWEIETILPKSQVRFDSTVYRPRSGKSPFAIAARSPFVGRERELTFLNESWQDVLSGRGGFSLIGGDAGVGKTRLAEEFADHLRWQGVTVVNGRCYEFEHLLPFQPIVEALLTIPAQLKTAVLTKIPRWAARELDRLTPTESANNKSISHPTPNQPDNRTQLFESLAIFLNQLSSQGPLLLILEDLHWASESTLQLLHYLARKLHQSPTLIIGTYRQETLGLHHPLTAIQRRLSRERLASPLHLRPLVQEAVIALLQQMSGVGKDVQPLAVRLHQESEGNPFFLIELCKMLFDTGVIHLDGGVWQADFMAISREPFPLPASINEAILSRINRLDEASQETIRTAAVLGREFDFDLLNAVLRQGKEETLEDLDELLRQQLLIDSEKVTARDYVFAHHKIQEAIYETLPRRHRQRLHAQVGTAMETVYGASHEYLAELAFHYEQGYQWDQSLSDKAVHYLLSAGDVARLIYAHEEAAALYRQALNLLQEMDDVNRAARALMKLGSTFHTAFDFERAHQAYEEAFQLWQAASRSIPKRLPSPAPHPLRIGLIGKIDCVLDPVDIMSTVSMSLTLQLFRGLVMLNSEMVIMPDVAKTWEISEGGCQYLFHLQDDAVWSDGAPLTAKDFEYAWKRLLSPDGGHQSASILYDVVEAKAYHKGEQEDPDLVGVKALDDHILLVKLEKPTAYFLHLLAQPETFAVPRHVIQTRGNTWNDPQHIVSSGPYMTAVWDPDNLISLTRNPAYHGRSTGNVEQIEFHASRDYQTMLQHYANNERDVVELTGLPGNQLRHIRQRFAADYLSASRLVVSYAGFNASITPLDDPRVRQALVLAVDQEKLANISLAGSELAATGGMVPPGMPGHCPGVALPYDPKKARQLLAKAGYPDGSGFPNLPVYSWESLEVHCDYLQQSWQKNLGITIGQERFHFSEVDDGFEQGKPLIFLTAWGCDCPDPDYVLRIGVGIKADKMHWQNDVYERLVTKARYTNNFEARMKLYQQAERRLMQEAVFFPLTYFRMHLLVKPWLKRFPISPISWWFWKDAVIEPY